MQAVLSPEFGELPLLALTPPYKDILFSVSNKTWVVVAVATVEAVVVVAVVM